MSVETNGYTFKGLQPKLASLKPATRAACIVNSYNYAGGCNWSELNSVERRILSCFCALGDMQQAQRESAAILAKAAKS